MERFTISASRYEPRIHRRDLRNPADNRFVLITRARGGTIDVHTGEGSGTAMTKRLPRGRLGF